MTGYGRALPTSEITHPAGASVRYGINIDAEEADRLEISLDLLENSVSSRNWQAGTASALLFRLSKTLPTGD